ncbi:amphiregulin-like [Lethenteron reissneri]|uniref:amphiregulin-like n=1 Tax=Lethenteron reissneri TaxID=7753 RepID=UPI002AB7598A|nr:amphiregulin-like [Lethenteron reissneri]
MRRLHVAGSLLLLSVLLQVLRLTDAELSDANSVDGVQHGVACPPEFEGYCVNGECRLIARHEATCRCHDHFSGERCLFYLEFTSSSEREPGLGSLPLGVGLASLALALVGAIGCLAFTWWKRGGRGYRESLSRDGLTAPGLVSHAVARSHDLV